MTFVCNCAAFFGCQVRRQSVHPALQICGSLFPMLTVHLLALARSCLGASRQATASPHLASHRRAAQTCPLPSARRCDRGNALPGGSCPTHQRDPPSCWPPSLSGRCIFSPWGKRFVKLPKREEKSRRATRHRRRPVNNRHCRTPQLHSGDLEPRYTPSSLRTAGVPPNSAQRALWSPLPPLPSQSHI